MKKTKNGHRDAAPQLDAYKRFIEAQVNCCVAFARLTPMERQNVVSLLVDRAQHHANRGVNTFGWDPQTEDELRICYLQLREIEKRMAKAWRRWAFELLKRQPSQIECRAAIRGLLQELEFCIELVEA